MEIQVPLALDSTTTSSVSHFTIVAS